MKFKLRNRLLAAAASAAVFASGLVSPLSSALSTAVPITSAHAADRITIDDMPSDYVSAADWIWNNRISAENSVGSNSQRYNNIFDMIIAGEGTINYVVKWQSYNTVTYEQRQQFETLVSTCINDWNDWLAGYENWPYDHIDVKVVGWAVIDKSCLLDLHDDEVVYTDTQYYDAQYDTTNGRETIPDKEPYAPSALSRFDHFADKNYEYPGGLDKRFDMYLWATQGFPDIGGCGGDWGQRLSDGAYLNMLGGSNIHVLEHEIGHGFGMTDFYGGEGESDGFPPGGFPGGGTSIMMAGSSAVITDFDGWMLRYMWTKIKDDPGRFDIPETDPYLPEITEYDDITMSLPDEYAAPGDVVNMAVIVSAEDGKQLRVASGEMNFDTHDVFPLAWVDRGSVLNIPEYDLNTMHFVMQADYEDQALTDDMGILYLGVKVPYGCPAGKYPVDFGTVVFKDDDGNDVTSHVTLKGGSITVVPHTTEETTTLTTTTETTTTTTTATAAATETTATTTAYDGWDIPMVTTYLTDTIKSVSTKKVEFEGGSSYELLAGYYDSEDKNLANYEPGDVVSISMLICQRPDLTAAQWGIMQVYQLDLISNVRDTTTTTTVTGTAPVQKKAGDATCDNEIKLNDAVLIMQALANPNRFGINGTDELHITEDGWANADCNNPGDGVTGKDALAIQKFMLQLIDALPEI